MGSFSVAHWAIVAFVILVLFGPGKISSAMGDLGKGIKAFRAGVSETEPPETIASPIQSAEKARIDRKN